MDSQDKREVDTYRVFLLRLWRDNHGPLHASLQAAGSTAPHRFADMEALIAFLRKVAATASPGLEAEPPPPSPFGAQAPAAPAAPEPGTQGG